MFKLGITIMMIGRCETASFRWKQVLRLTSRDHNAPSISALMSFCERASEWLNEDPNNVVAIHCQVYPVLNRFKYHFIASARWTHA